MIERCCGVPSFSHRCQRRVVHGPRRCHRVTPPGDGSERKDAQGSRAAYLVASPALILHGGDQQAGAAAGLGPCPGMQPIPARRLAQAHHRSHALAAALEPQDRQMPAEDFHLTEQPHLPDSRLRAARPLKLGATRKAGPPGSFTRGLPVARLRPRALGLPGVPLQIPRGTDRMPCLGLLYAS